MKAADLVALYQQGVTRRPEEDRLIRAVVTHADEDQALQALLAEHRADGNDLSNIGDTAAIEAFLRGGLADKVADGHEYGSALGAPLARVIHLADVARHVPGRDAAAPPTLAGTASPLPDAFEPPAPQDYLIGVPGDAFLPAHLVAGLVGPGSVGKSQLATQLAVCLALGIPFLGYSVSKPAKTVLVTGEDDITDFARKFYSVVEAMGFGATEWRLVKERVFVVDLRGRGVSFIESKSGGRFVPGRGVEDVAAEVARVCPDPDLLVIDTLSTLLGANEDVGPIAAFMSAMTALSGCFASEPAVLVAHHTSKENASRGAHGQDIGRGSSAFGNNARSVITVANIVKDNVGEVQRHLGGEVPRHIVGDLRLVQAVKVKGSKARPMRVVETVPAPSGLGFCFRPYVLPVEGKAQAEREAWRQAVAFRDLVVATAAETGKPVSVNSLVLPGRDDRSRAAIVRSVAAAEKAGLLRQERLKSRGKVLIPLSHPSAPLAVEDDAQDELDTATPKDT